jgi:hypothetical protein
MTASVARTSAQIGWLSTVVMAAAAIGMIAPSL